MDAKQRELWLKELQYKREKAVKEAKIREEEQKLADEKLQAAQKLLDKIDLPTMSSLLQTKGLVLTKKDQSPPGKMREYPPYRSRLERNRTPPQQERQYRSPERRAYDNIYYRERYQEHNRYMEREKTPPRSYPRSPGYYDDRERERSPPRRQASKDYKGYH